MWREYFKIGLAIGAAYRLCQIDASDIRALQRMGRNLWQTIKRKADDATRVRRFDEEDHDS